MKSRQFSLRFVVLVAIVAILASLTIQHLLSKSPFKETEQLLVNPVAHFVENNSLSIGARVRLQQDLERMAQEAQNRGKITNFSIYYRELISGPVIALNHTDGFFPASLLKLPVAMWYFQREEETPGFLEQEIQYFSPAGDGTEYYGPTHTLVPGSIYSLRELVESMLVESDNEATRILVEFSGGRDSINNVYHDVGIRDVLDYSSYTIDTQTYAAFFRVLYNSELLTESDSNEILEMLTRSSFEEGIRNGIPESVKVAHKFGERPIEGTSLVQLHDCGIVYVPENPYLLCIMTQGSDYDAMASFIAESSKKVFEAGGNNMIQ